MEVKQREWAQNKGNPKVMAPKGRFYIRALALFNKIKTLKGPSHITRKGSYILKGDFPQIHKLQYITMILAYIWLITNSSDLNTKTL